MRQLLFGRAVRETSAIVLPIWLSVAIVLDAQLPGSRVPGGCDVPAEKRSSDVGCYLTATLPLDTLPAGEIFWHIYQYPTRAAAEAAKPNAGSVVVESLGKVWLFAVGTADWRASTGDRAAAIGPLPVTPAQRYTARWCSCSTTSPSPG